MATSKLVSELVINQLTAAQYWQAKENGEIKADELYLIIPEKPKAQTVDAYTKAESDARFATKDTEEKLQGVRFENISRPGRPLPIAMRVDSPLGVMITGGPLQGYVSESDARKKYQPKGDYATKADLAQLGGGVPRGTWFAPMGPSAWEVPRGVEVVKITWAGQDAYFKVMQGGVIRAMIMSDILSGGDGDNWTAQRLEFYRASGTIAAMEDHIPNFSDISQTEFTISWSPEINAHAVDVDLTK